MNDNENVVDTLKVEVTSDSTKAVNGVEKLISTLERLKKATSSVSGAVSVSPGKVAATEAETEKLGETVEKNTTRFQRFAQIATKGLSRIKSAASVTKRGFGGFFDGLFGKAKELFRMFSRRVLYRAMNFVISSVVKGFKEGIDAVYQYSKAIDGRLAKSLDTMATSSAYLKASLGAMAAPLLNLLAPVLDKIIDKFVDWLNLANQIFARLSGATTWTKAVKVETQYADAVDEATKANKRFKASLLGIDEINALQSNLDSASSAITTNSGIAGFQFEEVQLNTAEVDKTIKKLEDILQTVKLIGIAFAAWKITKTLTEVSSLSKCLSGLDSLVISAAVTLTATSLTIKANALKDIQVNGATWENIGKDTAGNVGGTTGLAALGAWLGKKGLLKWLGITDAAGGAALFGGFGASALGGASMGAGIGQQIAHGPTLENQTLTLLGGALGGAGVGAVAGGPFGALLGALFGIVGGGFTSQILEIGDKVGLWHLGVDPPTHDNSDIVLPTIDDRRNDSDSWLVWENGKLVLYPIVPSKEKVVESVSNSWSPVSGWFETNVTTPVRNHFSNLGKDTSTGASDTWTNVKNAFQNPGEYFRTHVTEPIKTKFQTWKSDLSEKSGQAWQSVKLAFTNPGEWFKIHVTEPITAKFQTWKSDLPEKARLAWQGVKDAFKNPGEWFDQNVIQPIERFFEPFITWLNTTVLNPINELLGISGSTVTLPTTTPTQITLPTINGFADGGIVPTGQMFVAREFGAAELVGSIGRRTAVMNNDQIVDSVAQGVADANAEQNALLREEISILRQILAKDTSGGSYSGTDDILSALQRKNRRDGRTVVPVGV